jgi:hypothetical protein
MVRFRNTTELDPSQVEDRRGSGPGLGLPGGGLAVGGGGLGVVGFVIYLLVTLLSSGGGLGALPWRISNGWFSPQEASSSATGGCAAPARISRLRRRPRRASTSTRPLV